MTQFLKAFVLLIASSTLNGCTNAPPPAATSDPGVASDSSANTSANPDPISGQDAPDFDPRLTLAWPGTPEVEHRRNNAGSADGGSIYNASYSQTGPATHFSAAVYQLTEQDLIDSDPGELLVENALGGEDETTRREIKFGPKHYPGLDVTARSGDSFVRRVVVLAGTRIYAVSVLSTKEDRLSAADVVRFFDSFAIGD